MPSISADAATPETNAAFASAKSDPEQSLQQALECVESSNNCFGLDGKAKSALAARWRQCAPAGRASD